MIKETILEYKDACGPEAAADLLLLLGPDGFDGDFWEYAALMGELEQLANKNTVCYHECRKEKNENGNKIHRSPCKGKCGI